MRALTRLWRGETPLVDAFWNWVVLGGILVNGATSGGFLWLMSSNRPVLAILVGYAVAVPYNFVVAVGVWRAADRYRGDRVWAETARFVTVIAMVLLSVT